MGNYTSGNYRYIISAILTLLIAVLFGLLISVSSKRSIYIWDEAVYANNSMEMVKNGSYWVYTVGDTVDHHNTKPPLVLWGQALSIKAFGYNEFAIRLPTYLALIGTIIILIFYSAKITGSEMTGLIASIILLTNHGSIRSHVFLSGDLDGVLTMFTTWALLHILYCTHKKSFNRKDYVAITVIFCCGYLTKSTAIFLIVPSAVTCIFLAGRSVTKNLIFSRNFVFAVISFIAFICSYYVLREIEDPGYWRDVWYSEYTRLVNDIQPWVHYPPDHYFYNFYNVFFKAYLYLTVVAAIPFFLIRSVSLKRPAIQLLYMSLVYLAFISIPQVKLEWYDAPVYPLLCFALGIMIFQLCKWISGVRHGRIGVALIGLFLTIFAALRFKGLVHRLDAGMNDYPPEEVLSNEIRTLYQNHENQQSVTALFPFVRKKDLHSTDAMAFYKTSLALKYKKNVVLTSDPLAINVGDTVLVADTKLYDSVRSNFVIHELRYENKCHILIPVSRILK